MIAKLLESGIDIAAAYNNIYNVENVHHIRMLGEILSSAQCNKQGNIAWLVLAETDLKKFNVASEDTLGFINHLLILKNIQIACMFSQHQNTIKVSLRSGATSTWDHGPGPRRWGSQPRCRDHS